MCDHRTNHVNIRVTGAGQTTCARSALHWVSAMPIRTYLEDHSAFDPEEIKMMSKALEEACAALQVDGQDREIIAARIIDLARKGVIDATVLRDRVVEAMRSL